MGSMRKTRQATAAAAMFDGTITDENIKIDVDEKLPKSLLEETEHEAKQTSSDEDKSTGILISAAYKINGKAQKDFVLPLKFKSLTTKEKHQIPVNNVWIRETPIYVAEAKKPIPRDFFPKRCRGKSCYLCGLSDDSLLKCAGCPTRFHMDCAKKSVEGGYTYIFMKRNEKIYCPQHHCTACFADHNRTRCYNGEMIACDQCELAWHIDCIPAGCEINSKNEITCPRHVLFKDSPKLHFHHCADCQQAPEQGENLVKCTKCFRSVHFKCYSKAKLIPVKDTEDERNSATCHWCDMYDFIRYGEYAMGRLSTLKWYPCKVIRNSEYPNQKDPLLGTVGYVCVQWLPYRGKITYNLLSHNRIMAMTHKDYFFVTEAEESTIYEEWNEAQEHSLGPFFRPIKDDQIPSEMMSNGEKVKKIKHNKYSKPDLKTPRDRIHQLDLCKCVIGARDRCGPTSNCINRALRMECPKECSDPPNNKCQNRRISEGNNCINVKIKYFPGKGYGAVALESVPIGSIVGEYVGEIIDAEEKKRRMERIAALQSNEAQYYLMELDDRRAIDAQYYGNDMRYVNHSCNPNCVIQQIQSDNDFHLVLIAKQDIKKGEELSFDYNMQEGSDRDVPICRCGESNCTRILSADQEIKRAMYDWEEKSVSRSSKRLESSSSSVNRSISLPLSRKISCRPNSSFATSAPAASKRNVLEEHNNNKVPVKRLKTSAQLKR